MTMPTSKSTKTFTTTRNATSLVQSFPLIGVPEAVVLDNGDMSLPSGGVARHRSLVRYYKQHFRLGERPTDGEAALRFGMGHSLQVYVWPNGEACGPLDLR